MAAERDEAGPSGLGLSGAGRDLSGGMAAGMPRTSGIGDAPGSADVHAGIAFNTQATGTDAGLRERVTNRVRDVAETMGDTAGDLGQRARSLAGDVAGRASGLASQARERMGALSDRASEQLEERGWMNRLRENPLPALGMAFAAGFLLAGGGRAGRGQRVRGELRSAVAAGLSAGLAQGARAFLRNAGAEDGVINSLLENLPVLGGGNTGGGSSDAGRPRSASPASRSGELRGSGRAAAGGARREPSHRGNA